jgi:UDP-N-acetylglucosamine 2-epimerase (non-hydrolysing)
MEHCRSADTGWPAADRVSLPCGIPAGLPLGQISCATVHVVCVAAARPNFMKVKPVVEALEARGGTTTLVHTGQHYDAVMSDVFFEELGLRPPDHHLGAGSGSHATQTSRVMTGFEELLPSIGADALVVVGDVNSTLACAIVGAKAGLVVAHVEAGLRSRDWSMPEEVNRVVADRVSDLLFAPSSDAVQNLVDEGYRSDQIHLAGNVMIDTLVANRARAEQRRVWEQFGLAPGKYGVVTLHRPANVDDVDVLADLLGSIGEIAREVPMLFPVHPRTRQHLDDVLGSTSGIELCEPLGYLDFLGLMAASRMVLTDSGGIQEESTVLGVPCLTLRDNTERPITISEGTNQLVGRTRAGILAGAARVMAGEIPSQKPKLWDGRAGARIADVLLGVDPATLKRPTER